MGLDPRRSLALLALGTASSLLLASAGSCGGGGAAQGSGGRPATTTATGAGGSTGVVLVGSGGGANGTCGGPTGDAGDDGSTGCDGLEGGVAFADIAPLLSPCASETCHATPWTPPELVGVPAYECCDGLPLVTPGNANRSYLVHKLTGTLRCLPGRMPLNGPPYLADADVLRIRRWICEGAPDP